MEKFNDIERYLLGKMSAQEKADFEKKLDNDASLNAEKNRIAELILGVESLGLKNSLKGRVIGETTVRNITENKSASIISFSKLAIAASVAAVFICGWWFLQPDLSSNEERFADVFITDPGLPTKMSETDNYNFYDAMVEYKMENYDNALEIWTKNTTNIGQDTLDYYIGMAYLNQDNLNEAEKSLSKIDTSSAFYSKTQWYRLSILLEQEQYETARTMLDTLPTSIHPGYEEVKQYLDNK